MVNILVAAYIYFPPSLMLGGLMQLFKRSYFLKGYLAFLTLSILSVFGAKNVGLGLLNFSELMVVFVMFINFAILLYNRLHLIYKIAFLVGLAAFFQAGSVLYEFNKMATAKSVGDAIYANILKGNTGNINIFSASLLFKIPFLYLGIFHFSGWKRWFLTFALLFALTDILLINARVSLLSFITITIATFVYQVKVSAAKKQLVYPVVATLLAIFVAGGIANTVFKKLEADYRYKSTLARLGEIRVQDGSLQRRFTFWKAAFSLAKEKPVTGIGLGNYRVESIPLDLTTNESVPLHAHNDFVEILSETGFLNGVLYFSLFALLLFVSVKRLVKIKDKLRHQITFLTFLILIVYGLDALFNFPMFRPTMQVAFCFLIAFTLVNTSKIESITLPSFKTWNILLIALAFAPLYVVFQSCKSSHLEYQIQTDNINFNTSGVLNGDEVVQRINGLPNVFNTSESFAEYAGIYYFREKKYDKATKMLDEGNKINPYLGRPDFYKSLMAAEMGKADSAYFYAKTAFYRRPINENFLFRAADLAAARRDSVELMNLYAAYTSHLKLQSVWVKTLQALQQAGVSKSKINGFISQGLKEFPKDSLVTDAIKNLKVTEYLVEGQRFFAARQPQGAFEQYSMALKVDANNVYANQNMGFHYYNLGKYSNAVPYLLKALAKPGLGGGNTEYILALCYFNTANNIEGCKYANLAQANGSVAAADLIKQKCK